MICDDVSFYPHYTLCSFSNFHLHFGGAKVTDGPPLYENEGAMAPLAPPVPTPLSGVSRARQDEIEAVVYVRSTPLEFW